MLKVTQLLVLLGQTADTSCHIQCCTSDLCNSVTCPSKSTIAMTTVTTTMPPPPTITRTTVKQTTIVNVTTTAAVTSLSTKSTTTTKTTTTTTRQGSSPSSTSQPPTVTTTEDPYIATICHNPSVDCDQRLDPICSSEGHYYTNKCLFAKHYCVYRNETMVDLSFCSK